MIIEKESIGSKYCKLYEYQTKKIGIPIFQRFYDWKEPQIVQLKNDLLEVVDNKTKHLYFLDFIYYMEGEKVMLADGQQRIVTINNLIKAIKEVSKEKQIDIDEIDYFDISYDIFANDTKYKTHFSNYVTAPFKVVYLKLKEFVLDNVDRINDLIEVIKNNIYIYMKKCDNADDAFEIFQQINTGGKPLSKDEVIKTALDQYRTAYQINLDTSKMKDIRQSIISYYKLKKDEPDKKFDNMAIITFLKDYITKDKKSFQDFVDTIALLNKLEDNPIRYVINYINRTTLLDVLNILAMKKIDTNKRKEYMTKLMLPLCMMSVCLTLNAGTPTAFRYLLNDVIDKIKSDEDVDNINFYLINYINSDPVTWKISLNNFTEKIGLLETSRGLKRGLLIMDIIDKNVSGHISVPLINLEHVYPQTPDHEWAQNGWPSHSESQKPIIDNIGNYLLLCETVNKSVQNKYITHKVAQYKSIIVKDNLLQTPINTIDFERFEKEGASYVKERQKFIASRIREEFPFGKVLIIDSENSSQAEEN